MVPSLLTKTNLSILLLASIFPSVINASQSSSQNIYSVDEQHLSLMFTLVVYSCFTQYFRCHQFGSQAKRNSDKFLGNVAKKQI